MEYPIEFEIAKLLIEIAIPLILGIMVWRWGKELNKKEKTND